MQRGQRKQHFDTGHDGRTLTQQKLQLEVPRQHQIPVRPHVPRVFLGYNRDVRSEGMRAVLVGIAVGRRLDPQAVQAVPLEQHIALGGRAIDMNALAPGTDVRQQLHRGVPQPFYALLELGIGLASVQLHLEFADAQPPDEVPLFRSGLHRAYPVPDMAADAPAVDLVQLNLENFQPDPGHDLLKGTQAVVLQVLMANGVEGVAHKHERHVRHFKHPHAVIGQQIAHAGGEGDGIVQIIKHGDAGDDVDLFAPQHGCGFRRGEHRVRDTGRRGNALRDVRGIHPILDERLRITIEQRTVIAANVEHAQISTLGGVRLGLLGYAAQMVAHGLVGAGTVPIISVQDFLRKGIGQLEQSAGILITVQVAPDQLRGQLAGGRILASRFDEGALQVLLSKIYHMMQYRVSTNSTFENSFGVHGISPQCCSHRVLGVRLRWFANSRPTPAGEPPAKTAGQKVRSAAAPPHRSLVPPGLATGPIAPSG